MKGLLLVGSVPLPTAEEVIRMFGGSLGRDLIAMPDGEVGERRGCLRLSYQIFNSHPELEPINRPQLDNGIERDLFHATSPTCGGSR